MGVAQPVLVCAVLLGLLTPTPATTLSEDGQLSIQDIVSFLDYLQNKGMVLDSASVREHGSRKADSFLDNYQDEQLRTNEIGNEQDETMPTNKRASYMTLCHFKICNMGRKRGFIRKSSRSFLRRI